MVLQIKGTSFLEWKLTIAMNYTGGVQAEESCTQEDYLLDLMN